MIIYKVCLAPNDKIRSVFAKTSAGWTRNMSWSTQFVVIYTICSGLHNIPPKSLSKCMEIRKKKSQSKIYPGFKDVFTQNNLGISYKMKRKEVRSNSLVFSEVYLFVFYEKQV